MALNTVIANLSIGNKEKTSVFEQSHILIGRSNEADLVIDDPSVEENHLTIAIKEDSFLVTDHSTALGTEVNGEKILSNTPVSFTKHIDISLGDNVSIQIYDEALIVESGLQNKNEDIKEVAKEMPIDSNKNHDQQLKKLNIEVEIENIEEVKLELLNELEQIKVEKLTYDTKARHTEDKIINLQKDFDIELKKISELKLEANQFAETLDRKKEVEREINRLQSKKEQMLSEIAESQKIIYGESQSVNQEIGTRKVELAELEASKHIAKREKEELNKKIEILKHDEEKLLQHIDHSKQESLLNVESLRDHKRMSNDAKKSKGELERDIEKLEHLKYSLEKDLNKVQREFADLDKDMILLRNNKEREEKDYNRIQQEKNKNQDEYNEMMQDIFSSKKKMCDFQNLIESREIDITKLSNVIAQLENEKEVLESQIHDVQSKHDKSSDELGKLLPRLESIQADIQTSLSKSIQEEHNYKIALERKNKLAETTSELEATRHKLSAEKVALKQSINSYEVEKSKHLTEIDKLSERESKLSEKNLEAESKIADLSSKTNELKKATDITISELNNSKINLEEVLLKTDQGREEVKNIKHIVDTLKNEQLALDENIKKNTAIEQDSQKSSQKMLAEKNTIEFELQHLQSKKSHLESELNELGKTKERKFEELTQYKIRAEKDLEFLREQAGEKKREHQKFLNEIYQLERKKVNFTKDIEILEKEIKAQADNLKRQKQAAINDLQQIKDKIIAEKTELKENEFRTQKSKEAMQEMELEFSDVRTKMKYLEVKIANFDEERDKQLRKLGELKANSEHEVDTRRKILVAKMETELKKQTEDLNSNFEKYRSDLEKRMSQLTLEKNSTLDHELKEKSDAFENSKKAFISNASSQVQDILKNYISENHDSSDSSLIIDIESVLHCVFNKNSSNEKIMKRSILVYKLKNSRKYIAIFAAISAIFLLVAGYYLGQLTL